MAVIGKAHTVVHRRGVFRVQSSMRVGSRYGHLLSCYTNYSLFFSSLFSPPFCVCSPVVNRTDKTQTAADKVKRVNDILAKNDNDVMDSKV